MGALDWIHQHIIAPAEQDVGNAVSNAKNAVVNAVAPLPGRAATAAGNYIQNDVVQPVENQINPMGNGAVSNALQYLNGRINQNKLIPSIPTLSPAYSQGAPLATALSNAAIGIANIPASILNQGVVAPTADISNNASTLANGGQINYNTQLSGAGKLGAQLGGAQNAPQGAGSYVKNIAGVANPIVNAAFLESGEEAAGEAAAQNTLKDAVVAGAKSTAKNAAIGAGAGLVQGAAQAQGNSLGQVVGSAVKGAFSGLATGALLGAGSAALGAAGRGISAAAENTHDYPNLAAATHSYNAPIPETVDTPLQNGTVVRQPTQPTTVSVPESQGEDMLRKGNAFGQTIDYSSGQGQPQAHITFDQNTGQILSWNSDRPEFAKGIWTAAHVGSTFQPQEGAVGSGVGENSPRSKINPFVSDEQQTAIGKALGMSDQEIADAKAGISPITPAPVGTGYTDMLQTAQDNGAKQLSTPEPEGSYTPRIAEPQVGTPKEQAQSAISAKLAAEGKIASSAQIAIQAAKSADLSGEDAALFRDSIEHPEDAEKNMAQASNPAKFKTAMDRYRGFTNDTYKVSTDAGRSYGFRQNYYNHEYDLDELKQNQAASDEYDKFVAQKTQHNASSSSEIPRVFQDLREAREYGSYLQNKYGLEQNPFAPKNNSVAEDIAALTERSQHAAGSAALVQDLQRKAPGSVYVGDEGGKIPQGFIQLNVSGLRDTFVSPELYQHLKVLEPNVFQDNPIVHAADTANRVGKAVVLQGPFHAIREMIQATGDQLTGLRLPNFVEASQVALSPDAWANKLQEAKESGLLDFANDSNLKFGGTDFQDLTKPSLSMESMTFDRLIPYYKLTSFQTAIENEGLDLNNPADLVRGKQIAAQVNNFYGGLNNELNGRSKSVQQVLRFVALAPDYNEGKLRGVASAAFDWKTPAGSLARRQIAGQVVVTALATELARRFATGKFDSLKNALQNTVLNPNVPLPTSFNKPGSTTQQTVQLPSSVVGDISKFVQNPIQSIQGRGSNLLSLGDSILTGKDYYGNPLVNPFTNPNPTLLQKTGAALSNELPIPVEAFKNALQGKSSYGSAALNAIGGRVVNNPQAPQEIATTKYYNTLNTFTKSLNPNEQNWFNALNPTTKDQDGNPVFNKSSVTSAVDAALLASQPAFAQKYAQFELANQTPSSGNYQTGKSYPAGTAVTYQGQTYVALKPTSSIVPGSEPATQSGKPDTNAWAYQDPIWQLKGNTLINALQARAATGLSDKSALDPNAASVSTVANTYLKNSTLFQGEAAFQKLSGPGNYDPLYNLTGTQAQQVLYVRTLSGVEATGDPTATAIKAQPWYKQFEATDEAWYNAHPITGSSTAPAPLNQYPTMSPALSAYANYIAGLGTSAEKSAAYNTPTGQALDQYYDQLDQYNSQKQAQLLQTPINVPASAYSPGYVASPVNSTTATPSTGALAAASGALNLPVTAATSSSNAVSKALETADVKREARKTLSSMSKSSVKKGKIRAPKFKPVNVKAHVRLIKVTGEQSHRPTGTVRRPSSNLS